MKCQKPKCPSLILPPRSRSTTWQLIFTLNPHLSPSSCHPKHCFKSIPFSQAIKVKKICSTVETTKQRLGDLHHLLKRRGYNDKVIESGFSKASEIDRNDLLGYKEKKINKRVPLVLTYHPVLEKISDIVRHHWKEIQKSEKLIKLFPEPPVVAFRRPKSMWKIKIHVNQREKTNDLSTFQFINICVNYIQ